MNKKTSPLVSVVMSVYNGEKYLREAIDSILNQTFTDFEFIIINDGSTDDTLKIIKSYKDPRIVLISRKNLGLVASLNEGIKKAKGKYIARQDADDVSHERRLGQQVDVMHRDPNNLICGTFAVSFDTKGKKTGELVFPYLYPDVQRRLAVANTLVHGSILMKRQIAQKGYSADVGPAEDYDLWLRSLRYKMCIVPQFLYYYRDNPEGISQKKQAIQADSTDKLKLSFMPIVKIPFLRPSIFFMHLKSYSQTSNLARIYVFDQAHIAHELWNKKSYLSSCINLAYYYSGRLVLKIGGI